MMSFGDIFSQVNNLTYKFGQTAAWPQTKQVPMSGTWVQTPCQLQRNEETLLSLVATKGHGSNLRRFGRQRDLPSVDQRCNLSTVESTAYAPQVERQLLTIDTKRPQRTQRGAHKLKCPSIRETCLRGVST